VKRTLDVASGIFRHAAVAAAAAKRRLVQTTIDGEQAFPASGGDGGGGGTGVNQKIFTPTCPNKLNQTDGQSASSCVEREREQSRV